MKQICAKCSTESLCPQCNYDAFNRPLVVQYIDKEMPIIIFTCHNCHVELFKSMTYHETTINKNFCMACIGIIETESFKYRDLCK